MVSCNDVRQYPDVGGRLLVSMSRYVYVFERGARLVQRFDRIDR